MQKPSSAILRQVIAEQRDLFLRTGDFIDRDILHRPDFAKICLLKEIVVITGVRRCGKSFLMRLIWRQLKNWEKKLSVDNFLCVNFEDEKLLGFDASRFDLLLEIYRIDYSINENQTVYLFFDEIQIIPGWDKFLRRLAEDGRYKIFVTGSNATLLSKEISSTLTGRNFQIIIYPLSFREYVNFTKKEILNQPNLITAQRAQIQRLFRQYWQNGGFPEVVIQQFRPLLQDYLKNIIYRDIVLRYNIKYVASLREIVSFVASNLGVPISLRDIAKMTGIKNLMTVKKYLSYLIDSYLFYSISQYSHSVKQMIYNPDKFYVADTGIYHEVATVTHENTGRVLENLVFLELQRRDYQVYFFQGENSECDFIAKKNNRLEFVIQATAELSPQNKEREAAGLAAALISLKVKHGLILTMEESGEIMVGNKKVSILPVWQWLLNINL